MKEWMTDCGKLPGQTNTRQTNDKEDVGDVPLLLVCFF